MRVTLSYEDKLTIKVKLPKKWLSGTTETLKDTILEQHNKKFPDNVLDGAAFHLELENGTVLCCDDIVQKKIPDRATVKLMAGPSPTMVEAAAEAKRVADAAKPVEDPNDPTLTCRNFGCQKNTVKVTIMLLSVVFTRVRRSFMKRQSIGRAAPIRKHTTGKPSWPFQGVKPVAALPREE